MVEWLAGNRIRGTSTERTSTDFNAHLISPSVGGWKELGRTTLGSSNTNIDVASLADKRYLMWLCNTDSSGAGNIGGANRVGNSTLDTGSNYSDRYSENGASDATRVNRSSMSFNILADEEPRFYYGYISNIAGSEKLMQTWSTQQLTLGAGNPPNRGEWVGKWANTSNAVSRMTTTNTDTGTYDTGSEVVVLGWDPDDTHTTNFWEELASVSGAGSSTTLSSGTITAKKYLWVQVYADTATSACGFQFNNDTGANYSRRYNMNGGSDGAHLNHTSANISGNSPNVFINCFIINNSANEKLLMCNTVYAPASGAGDDPERSEDYSKWANTSSQITESDVIKGSNWGTNSILKVWGSN